MDIREGPRSAAKMARLGSYGYHFDLLRPCNTGNAHVTSNPAVNDVAKTTVSVGTVNTKFVAIEQRADTTAEHTGCGNMKHIHKQQDMLGRVEKVGRGRLLTRMPRKGNYCELGWSQAK